MKKTFKFFIIAFLLCLLLFVCKIDSIPQNIILYGNENLNLGKFWGLNYKIGNDSADTVLASTIVGENIPKESIVQVKLLDSITVKEVKVNVIDKTTVIPVGQISGLKLYTNGVMIVGMSEVKGEDNQKYKPYENSNIEVGDRIIKINEEEIQNTKNLIDVVNKSNGDSLEVEFVKNNEIFSTNITPVKMYDNTYKLGLWVRDSSAGIGTLTVYEPETGNFAALGHGITDIDTGDLVEIQNGEFVTANIVSIVKGKKGNPGKIQGTIENSKNIGTIYKNTDLGIYGTLTDLSAINIDLSKQMKVARRSEIILGKATALCNIDESKVKEYEIEIEKIFINNNKDNKSMLIKVKDQDLIQKTGGIIQGMSGSPIIQNGKFIGAITNVLVNDPTQGYAVFGDIMVSQMEEEK